MACGSRRMASRRSSSVRYGDDAGNHHDIGIRGDLSDRNRIVQRRNGMFQTAAPTMNMPPISSDWPSPRREPTKRARPASPPSPGDSLDIHRTHDALTLEHLLHGLRRKVRGSPGPDAATSVRCSSVGSPLARAAGRLNRHNSRPSHQQGLHPCRRKRKLECALRCHVVPPQMP